ncbi:hypothetical protein E4U43_003914 [Claviceps pusilla]|uniref:DUF1772-domain-containing protein n=1 Tax=Claviceps pusilla TaxID=123648 RepID=A0A9P7NF98_9HYPO|nr:hypothetical protein E4U43_003914 [Claviceps pusilla]
MCVRMAYQPTMTAAHALALASGCFLSGAMFCISAVMVPALLDTDAESSSLVAHWARLYHYGSMMMPSMSAAITIVYVYAAAQYHQSRRKQRVRCVAAGALTMAIVPFTFYAMAPTNNALFAMGNAAPDADETARSLVIKWAVLHAVRSCMPLAGVMVASVGLPEAQQPGGSSEK